MAEHESCGCTTLTIKLMAKAVHLGAHLTDMGHQLDYLLGLRGHGSVCHV